MKGVGSGAGSGSISQRYGSEDPDPHQNVTDPQHWLEQYFEIFSTMLWNRKDFLRFRFRHGKIIGLSPESK
jgi:hypothetical protein